MESARPATAADIDTIVQLAADARAAVVGERGGALLTARELGGVRTAADLALAIDDDVPPGTPGRVVGFVNAVGDGVLAAYVPCLEVLPAWQGQGIGSELVRRILDALESRYMVDLVCDEDVVPFYERLGFAPYRAMIRRDRVAIMSGPGRNQPEGGRDQST